MIGKRLSNFQQRAIFGTLLAIILAIAVLFAHVHPFQYFFLFILALMQAVALWEYYHLAKAKGFKPLSRLGISFSTAYITTHFLTMTTLHGLFYSEFLLYLFGFVTFVSYFKQHDKAIGNLGITFFGFLYVTLPLSLLIDLMYGVANQSAVWLIFLVATTKMCDTCAYFTGKKFGKHQFAPLLSPKKTIEGCIGGIIGSAFTGFIFFTFLNTMNVITQPTLSLTETLVISFFIAIAGIFGDLAESLLKRDANVKDSNALPGFGGVLDMVDSTLFTAPLLYVYLRAKMIL